MLHKIAKCCKILFIIFVFVACSNKKEDEKLFEELNLCLENSNKIIENKSQYFLSQLEGDLQKAITKDKASIWLPKAKNVEKLSNELIVCIDSLQKQIKDGKKIEENDIKILYNNLVNYKQKILLIDNRMTEDLRTIISLTNDAKDVTQITETTFSKGFTSSNPFVKLATYKNRVVSIKEVLIEYCSLTDIVLVCGMIDHFSFIASQNSTHFKPNETLEIKAGVGIFSKAANPKISVNNNDVKVNDEGVAEYKTKVPNEKGTYKKLVKIEFTKPDGTIGTAEKEIIYTVDE